MKATSLINERNELGDCLLKMVVWEVPQPVPPCTHPYRYNLAYVNRVKGERIVCFDNERGKGDHVHLDGQEFPYEFRGLDQLFEDFYAAVEAREEKA
jgi:hypothetical protein